MNKLPEEITFNNTDFMYKKNYFNETYNKDLIHKKADFIQIIDWKFN